MTFNFENLEQVRKTMIEEIDLAVKQNDLYYSTRFTEQGKLKWPELLKEAAEKYNEHWLAYQMEANALIKGMETAKKPLGGYTVKHVPDTAAETLADGQFNRYYMIAVCRQAISENKNYVTVYRAKVRQNPRSESKQLIGNQLYPKQFIVELRNLADSFKSKMLKPNSGLSIKL